MPSCEEVCGTGRRFPGDTAPKSWQNAETTNSPTFVNSVAMAFVQCGKERRFRCSSMKQYDPLKPPDPEQWRSIDEQEQIQLVQDYHRRARINSWNECGNVVGSLMAKSFHDSRIGPWDEKSAVVVGAKQQHGQEQVVVGVAKG